jgi:hypothetical protein
VNKNFDLNREVILTSDLSNGTLRAGSAGKITAFLPEEEGHDVIAIWWHMVVSDNEDVLRQAEENGYWTSYKPFSWALDMLNDHAEVVEDEKEYKELVERMSWSWKE